MLKLTESEASSVKFLKHMSDTQTTIQELRDQLRAFRDARDWAQFHDAKNVAAALAVEAGELLEIFLWKEKSEIEQKMKDDPTFKGKVKEELADVFTYVLTMANSLEVDLTDITREKMAKSEKKYPIEKAKGNAKKYTEL